MCVCPQHRAAKTRAAPERRGNGEQTKRLFWGANALEAADGTCRLDSRLECVSEGLGDAWTRASTLEGRSWIIRKLPCYEVYLCSATKSRNKLQSKKRTYIFYIFLSTPTS